MDDQTFLQILQAEPDNDETRSAYWNWLEKTNDNRAPYVRLMRERMRLRAELEKTQQLLSFEELRIDIAWIELAFPMRTRSPMVGVCYMHRSPDAARLVELGSRVTPDTVVCIIEAMKVFYEIKAGCEGTVSEVAVADGAPVEYGQVLFRFSRPWGTWS